MCYATTCCAMCNYTEIVIKIILDNNLNKYYIKQGKTSKLLEIIFVNFLLYLPLRLFGALTSSFICHSSFAVPSTYHSYAFIHSMLPPLPSSSIGVHASWFINQHYVTRPFQIHLTFRKHFNIRFIL